MVNEKVNNIREMLNNGDSVTLICVNKEEFAPVHRSYNEDVLRSGGLEVSSVNESGGVVLKNGLTITKSELRFFEIKECGITFDELVDIAVQAWKDGIVEELILNDFMSIATIEDRYDFAKGQTFGVSDTINKIKSLYNESFTIECEDDLRRLKEGARVCLSNKEEVTFIHKYKDALFFSDESLNALSLPLIALKGATVTQRWLND